MVRRRTDEADTRRRMAGLGDPRIHLVSRQLTALTRLRPLCHLDLQIVSIAQILGCHTEASGSDLLDRRATRRVIESIHILTTFAGIRLGTDAVHRNGQRFVRLSGN